MKPKISMIFLMAFMAVFFMSLVSAGSPRYTGFENGQLNNTNFSWLYYSGGAVTGTVTAVVVTNESQSGTYSAMLIGGSRGGFINQSLNITSFINFSMFALTYGSGSAGDFELWNNTNQGGTYSAFALKDTTDCASGNICYYDGSWHDAGVAATTSEWNSVNFTINSTGLYATYNATYTWKISAMTGAVRTVAVSSKDAFYVDDIYADWNNTVITAPTITLLSPSNTSTTGGSVNLTAEFNSTAGAWNNATFYIWYSNGTLFNSTTVSLSGQNSIETIAYSNLGSGVYLWNVKANYQINASNISFDSASWVKYAGNPIMSWGTGWESSSPGIVDPAIYYNATTNMYFMFYTSGSGSTVMQIGYATNATSDFTSWTKYASNPVITNKAGTFDAYYATGTETIINNGTNYFLFHHGYNTTLLDTLGVEEANLTDFPNTWNSTYCSNPVASNSGSGWDGTLKHWGAVYYNTTSKIYEGLYAGYDGTHWRAGWFNATNPCGPYNLTGPVIDLGSAGQWDAYGTHPTGLYYDNTSNVWWAFYQGEATNGGNWQMGVANCTSQCWLSASWTKGVNNPIIASGGGGAWDADIENPAFMLVGNTAYQFYIGAPSLSGTGYQLGMATLNIGTTGSQNATWSKNGNFTFTVDATAPTINITYPYPNNTVINYQIANDNLVFNWTVNDSALSTCWYTYQNVNTTVTCSDNGTYLNTTSANDNNVTFWANDTLGNLASLERSWIYNVFQSAVKYNNQTLEGATEVFYLNFTKNPSLQVAYINLMYNSSSYPSAYSISNNNITTSTSISVPIITSSFNSTFYWSIGFTDGEVINTTSYNQTIDPILIDDCSSYTHTLLNYTMYDEYTLEKLVNVTINLQVNIFDLSRSQSILNFSKQYTSSPATVCLNTALTSNTAYSLNAINQYYANDSGLNYTTRYYDILNYTLSSTSIDKNITLYDLLSSQATPFQLTFKDANLAPDSNILVYVNKQYPQDADYKTVEVPVTDSNGQTILNLVTNTAIYNLVMVDESGTIVASFSTITAYCNQYQSCTLSLNAQQNPVEYYNYTQSSGVSYSMTYSNTSKVITVNFNTLNGSATNVSLQVLSSNQFQNQTICSSYLVTSIGTILCNLSNFTDATDYFWFTLLNSGTLVTQGSIDASSSTGAAPRYGADGFFIAFLLILLLISLFADDKQMLVIMLGLGWLAVIGLGFVSGAIIGGGSAGAWLIVTILIFLWKLKNQEVGTTG